MRPTSTWLEMPPSPASLMRNKYSWVITNPATMAAKEGPVVSGKTYMVQGHEKDEAGKW